jgi:hypothetical protein
VVPPACVTARRDGVIAASLPVSPPGRESVMFHVAMVWPPLPSQQVRARGVRRAQHAYAG